MNLYLLENTKNQDWGKYFGAVVAAKDEESARLIHPSGRTSSDLFDIWEDWDKPENLSVKCIGIAAEDIPPGVVISHYVNS